MAPLEEPGIGELIRTLSQKLDFLSGQLTALQGQMSHYVTQEQRAADRALDDERRTVLSRRLTELEADRKADRRLIWSGVAGPVIVGLVLWFLVGGGSK